LAFVDARCSRFVAVSRKLLPVNLWPAKRLDHKGKHIDDRSDGPTRPDSPVLDGPPSTVVSHNDRNHSLD